MNRRFAYCFVALMGLACTRAKGDVTAMPPDPPILGTAITALNVAPYANEFAKIGPEVNKLVQNAGDKATVSMVRQWLIGQNPPTASNPYQAAYAKALNDAFVGAMSAGTVPVTAEINFGIVISSLSGPKENLTPAVIQLLGASNPAVVMWGERSAGAILPLALQGNNFNNGGMRDALLAAIIAGVVAHPDGTLGGPIADDAYRSINPKLWRAVMPPAAALSSLIDANLKLQQSRLTIYASTGVPASPKSDTYASFFLLSSDAWNAMALAQQLQAVQQASDLVSLAGQRAAIQAANLNNDLIEALQEEGKWISTLGTIIGDANVQAAGTAVNKLTLASPPATIRQACDAVYTTLQGIPTFSTLNAPPTINGAGPKSASQNPTGTSPTSEARP